MSEQRWTSPHEELPKEREFVLVMLGDKSERETISGPHVAWLRYFSDGWKFICPALASRDSFDTVPLVWASLEYDEEAARKAARGVLTGRSL